MEIGVSNYFFLLGVVLLSGVSVGFLSLALAMYIFFSRLGTFGLGEWVLLLSFAGAYPLAAYLSASVLDRFSILGESGAVGNGRVFVKLSLLLAFVFILQSDVAIEYIFTLSESLLSGGIASKLAAWTSLGNAAIFCAVVSAASITMAALLVELPYRWILAASGESRFVHFASCFRTLLVVLILCVSFQLVVGLFVSELHPKNWL